MTKLPFDGLSLLLAGIVTSLTLLAVVFSAGVRFTKASGPRMPWSHRPVYYVLLAVFGGAMLLVVLVHDFALLWFGVSLTTLATAFLVGYSGEPAALEAAWKYLVLCSVGIALALLGIVMLARAGLDAGLTPAQALDWNAIAAHAGAFSASPLARLAIAIAIVGFATKAGLVPMHAWLPDAHSKAPAPISGLLSGVLVSCALYAVVRTLGVAGALGAGASAQTLVLWLGAASIVVAGTLMLTQRDLKRLLAYSTVEHAGIVALALGFGGPLGVFAALFHLTAHAFAKSTAFLAVGLVQNERGTTEIGRLRGLWSSGSAGRLLLGSLTALSGMPPFGLFVSELLVVAAGIAAHRWLALGVAAPGLLLAFAALTRAAVEIEGGQPRTRSRANVPALAIAAAAAGLAGSAAIAIVPWTGAASLFEAIAAGMGAR
jgi:hydrogenase-4 component F